MNASQTPDAPKATPSRWVWRCTETSIAAGQISLLAVAETLAAVALYWWLSPHFHWHWFSLFGLIAAPILLLRSEESVKLGVEMLRRWYHPQKGHFSRREKVGLLLSAALVGGCVAYFLAHTWLPGHVGWAWFWRAGIIGIIVFEFAGAVAVAVAFLGLIGVLLSATAAVKVATGGGWSAASGVIPTLLSAPAVALGASLRALCIRWCASLRYLSHGLRRLPHNWRENLWVVDLTHPPELLPQAGSVDMWFTVAGLLRSMAGNEGFLKTLPAIVISVLYLPALAYRWSLKASAWLWWPLALALTPPFQGMDGYARRERAAVVSRGAWAFPLLLPLTLLVWLLLSLWPELKDWLLLLWPAAAETTQKLLALLKPPPMGLRYGLLWLVVLLALALAWYRKNLLAAYATVLDSPKEYRELSEQERAEFEARASGVERLRLWMIVALFLFGEAFALDFAHARNPAEIEHLIWPWLLAWL